MKVLHILYSSTYSGAEKVVITIINNKCENIDYAYASLDGTIREELERNHVNFFPMSKMSVHEIRRIVKLYHPDVVHAHDFTSSVMVAISMIKIPIISHLHQNSPWIKTCHPYSIIYLISSVRYKRILVVSDAIRHEYRFGKYIMKKIRVVSNPIQINEILQKSKQGTSINTKYQVVYVGRLHQAKDPLRFINLMAKLVSSYPSLRVAMIGDGKLKEECMANIQELKLENNISLIGYLNNPYPIIANARVLCITSKWEGFGLVAAEALTLGIPVVGTYVGGLQSIIDSGCGLLTNDENCYIDEVIHLISDELYWNTKSQNAKQKSYTFDNIEIYISKLCKIYKEII